MDNKIQRILFVNSEMFPYLPETKISSVGRSLPQGIQERKKEIRSFMPRYGCINERKNQLHEVIRLSGMNIIISEVDRPLLIKVASISSARIQVYFIDNDDYFRRKGILTDDKGKWFADNDERAIFFARGVLETVKKLRWAPDIIHCQGWITQFLPLYLKKAYRDDPIFSSSKVVLSLYDDIPEAELSADLDRKVLFGGISEQDAAALKDADSVKLARMAIKYSDGIILGSDKIDGRILEACTESGLPVLPFDAESLENGKYIEEYDNFYERI